jgi:hypothetical protein
VGHSLEGERSTIPRSDWVLVVSGMAGVTSVTLINAPSFRLPSLFFSPFHHLLISGQQSYDSQYTVALNSAQYGGGYPGPQCFKNIVVQANGVTVGGVRIMDECPTCDWGGLVSVVRASYEDADPLRTCPLDFSSVSPTRGPESSLSPGGLPIL